MAFSLPNFRKLLRRKQDAAKIPALVFDFGTSSVKILRCNYLPERVEIVSGKKVNYPPGSVSGDEFINPERVFPALQEAVSDLTSDETSGRVLSAAAGLGGLSLAGFTSQINYRRANSDRPLSEGEFFSILKKVETRADQIMRKLIAWETAEGGETSLVSSEVLELTLDGYSVASPVGSAGSKLAFTVYNSYTKSVNLKAVSNLISDLKLDLACVVPTIYAQLRLLLEKESPGVSFALLDVGAKTTELGLVVKGRIIGHLGFDVAGEAFSRSVASAQSGDEQQGEALKLAFAAGKLPQELSEDIRGVIASDCKVFSSGVELLLKEFPGLKKPPERLYISGGGSLLPGLSAAVRGLGSLEDAMPENTISPVAAYPKDMLGFDDKTGKLNSPADVPALATALDSSDLVRV